MADQFLGLDLSTQQLKAIIVTADLRVVHEAKVDFDADLSHHGIKKGVLANPALGEVFAPVALWLEALDLVLARLKAQGAELHRVRAVSGAGMQHGTVFWNGDAEGLLSGLEPARSLVEQLGGGEDGAGSAFSHAFSPNWQDASTQRECEAFDAALGGAHRLAAVTGSSAHHRFSGPQILRFRTKYPDAYSSTRRISLVSSFLASLFLGAIAPIDISDACGTNLFDVSTGSWNDELLALAAGSPVAAPDLAAKLGHVPPSTESAKPYGTISRYHVAKYGFSPDTLVLPFTGDNPATILALPLRARDAIVSLGTSTTFLMSTASYAPDPAYHLMPHPTTPGLYMFMLCYKNGGLAREKVRDAVNAARGGPAASGEWDAFNEAVLGAPVLGLSSTDTKTDVRAGAEAEAGAAAAEPTAQAMRIALFFPLPEIVPNMPAGTWRALWDPATQTLQPATPTTWPTPAADARAILESQFLSIRARSQSLFSSTTDTSAQAARPRNQPRRIYLVGGGAQNPAIQRLAAQVLGGSHGVFTLDIGANACALGGAYRAAWAWSCSSSVTSSSAAVTTSSSTTASTPASGSAEPRDQTLHDSFEDFLERRWDESGFARRGAGGYERGVWEGYEEGVRGLGVLEERVGGGW